jgi:alpha-L-fucosidase
MSALITRRNFLGTAAAAGSMSIIPQELTFASTLSKIGGIPVPTSSQKRWADMELGMFFHFDIPVFKPDWRWRSFKNFPDPKLYNPTRLDTDQWMEAAKAYGAKYVVFVAKHCSGFLQWQSDLYPYGLKQSTWRNGKGDVVKDFVDSARRYGLQPGLYASVSANAFLGVDNPGRVKAKGCYLGNLITPDVHKRYAKICEGMAEELWSRYGELFEIWFDGGALPPSKGGPDLMPLIEKYQPNALLFQGPAEAKNLIRWVGNERGLAPYPCWATGFDGTQADGTKEGRFSGNPAGNRWIPGECDVPLAPGRWFCHEWPRNKNWSMEYLINMYDRSVGRNCNLLLNAAPRPDGLIAEDEMKIYAEYGKRIKARYSNMLSSAQGEGMKIELDIPKDKGPVNQVILSEKIEFGERVRKFNIEALVEGEWKKIYSGSCIGHKHIVRFNKTPAQRLRLSIIQAVSKPLINCFSSYCN